MARVPYSSTVGSIMYVMVCTHSNIAQADSVVIKYMSCPEKTHWQVVKWILRYLREISNCCLKFGRNNDTLVDFVGSEYIEALDRIRLLSRYVFCISNCVVS